MNYKDSENLKQVRDQQQKRRQHWIMFIDLLSLLIFFDKISSSRCFMITDMMPIGFARQKTFLSLDQF